MTAQIAVRYAADVVPSSECAEIEHWAVTALANHPAVELSIYIVGIQEATQLNKKWRQKDYPSNVLSFPLADPALASQYILGDVVICLPVVASEAAEQQKSLQTHLAHMVIHGILHLLHYDHEQEQDAVVMEAKEIQILAELNYPNPYISCVNKNASIN